MLSHRSSQMKKRKKARVKSRSTSSSKVFARLGFSGWAIIFLAVAILTFFGSMLMNQKSAGKTETTFSTVTLQILNGCGVSGASEEMSRALLPGDGSLVYDVIEKGNAKLNAFDKTMIVDRRGSGGVGCSEQALNVADRLGIDSDDIVLQKFEKNILEIDVTIIVGVDFKEYVEKLNTQKEAVL